MFDRKHKLEYWNFFHLSCKSPLEAPPFGTTVPCSSRAAGAKWVLAMLPRLELSLFPPAGPLQTCRAVGDRRNLWQTSSCWANGQTNKLAAPLSHQPPISNPPWPCRPLGGGFDSFIAEGLGGRQAFVSHFIQSVWFPARHSSQFASYL